MINIGWNGLFRWAQADVKGRGKKTGPKQRSDLGLGLGLGFGWSQAILTAVYTCTFARYDYHLGVYELMTFCSARYPLMISCILSSTP